MKSLHLVWASLTRRKARTILTLLSVLVAFLLFGLLDTVRSTFSNFGYSSAGYTRLVTIAKMPVGAPLPLDLYSQIREVPGVANVEYGYNFAGTYRGPKNTISLETHTENFYDVYPELAVSPDDRLAFQHTRTGALAGEALLKKFNWKVGDKIPLQTSLIRKDGSSTWTFDLVGTYHFTNPGMKVWEDQLFIRWDYVDEARESENGTVTWYSIKTTDPAEVDSVVQAVDALSANSGHETKTQSENAFSAALIAEFGDLGFIATSIIGAVFFTLLLLTRHTMTQAVHERIRELAVLKAVGFTGHRLMGLVLGESVSLLLLGSAAGLTLATIAVDVIRSMPGDTLPIPLLPVGASVWLRGLILAMLIGLVVGAVPGLRGLRLQIADVLSGP